MEFKPISKDQFEKFQQDEKFRVISVEDNDMDYYLLAMFLEKHYPNKFEIMNITRKKDIYDGIEKFKPDILFLDIYLHGETTIDTIDYLQSKYPEMYIIMLSGQDDIRMVLECVEKGVSYILKGENLEGDLIKTTSSALHVIELIKANSELIKRAFREDKFPMAVFKMDTIGPKLLTKDFDKLDLLTEDKLDDALLELGMYTLFSAGQGEEYSEGLAIYQSGLFQNFILLVFSFRLMDKEAEDPRLKNGYFQIVFFIEKEHMPLLPEILTLEKMFYQVMSQMPNELKSVDWVQVKKSLLDEIIKEVKKKLLLKSKFNK